MKTIHALLFTLIVMACQQTTPITDDTTPPLFPPPTRVELNNEEGYVVNPFSGDSVPVLYNYYLGDTVKTGKPLQVFGKQTCKICIVKEEKLRLDIPKSKLMEPNVRKIETNIKSIDIDERMLEVYDPRDSATHKLVNYSQDTISLGIPVDYYESPKAWKQPKPKKALLPSMSDNARFDIKYLQVEQGMPSSSIYSIVEDRKGMFWFGTEEELSQFDGISFLEYDGDENPWFRFCRDMLVDSKGDLWIASSGGIVKTNGQTYSLIRREDKHVYANDVLSLFEDSHGNIWFGSQDDIIIQFRPASDGKAATITHHIGRKNAPFGNVSGFGEDQYGNIWFSTTSDGVFRYDGQVFTHFDQTHGLPDNKVNSICLDKNGSLWFGTEKGACRYDQDAKTLKGHFTIYTTKEGLTNDRIQCIRCDHDGNIWMATWGGGINKLLYDPQSKTYPLVYFYNKTHGLSHDLVRTLYEDRSGNMWIGTHTGGVNILKINSFEHLIGVEGLTNRNVRAIHEDRYNNFWIGTEGLGINLLQKDQAGFTQNLKLYTAKEIDKFRTIYSIFEDNEHDLWLASKDDVYRMTPAADGIDGDIMRYTIRVAYDQAFTGIVQDKNGHMWLGTYGGGLIQWKRNGSKMSDTLYQYLESDGFFCNYIFSMAIDKEDNIWIASDYGLCRFTPNDDGLSASMTVFSEKEGLPTNYLNSIAIDEESNIWLGTSFNGITSFTVPRNGKPGYFNAYTTKQGVSNNRIESIYTYSEPINGTSIWASTGNGLTLIQTFDSWNITPKVFSFSRSEGLNVSEYNGWGVYRDRHGQIWWAGGKGIEKLDLSHYKLSSEIPKPFLRSIDVNGKHLKYHDLSDSLRTGIAYEKVVSYENYMIDPVFAFNKNNLTFHFTAIDWHAPQKIRYSYIIEKLSDTWSTPSAESKAEYRNLPSGTHTFKVRAIGESQQWSEPFEYTFTIRPPWWYSWWALVLYICFGGFVLYRTYRFQLDRKMEIAERQKLVELDRVKNRLYTNITHEFRTPLTLIHGPVTQALSKNATLDKKDIQSIHRQSERLQELINQMLELQKLEAGMLKPNYAYGEIIQMLRYLFGSFETWAGEKNISMIFSSSLQEVYMDVDKEKLTQIITNLVNNAIKHTPRNGKVAISVNASATGEFLLIHVSDTGTGISEEDLPFIFDRFYQSKRAAVGGTGIGLAIVKNLAELLGGSITVQSKLSEGTTFILKLPITKHAPKASELSNSALPIAHEIEDEETHFASIESLHPGKPIVLVIEDHPEVSQYIVSCLAQEYNTLTAMNGDAGLQTALEKVPDLIISDVMMPGKDGFELTRMLKKDIQTSHIPIILLTGRGDHEAMMTGIEHGADAYVIKPFDPTELVLRVKKLLELRADLSLHYRKHATAKDIEPTKEASPRENEFLNNMRLFIEARMNDSQFNMDMLSHHMAMSHPQLHRKITALTGESVGKFVRSIRLTKAKELLKNSDLTISEIAYETGFSEPGYFTKVFSKEFNVTPTDYRAKPF